MLNFEILLDHNIRDYATIPILVVVIAFNFLRGNISQILKDEPKVDMKQLKQNNVLARARMLKSPASLFLTEKAYRNRKAHFVKKDTGLLMNPPKTEGMAGASAADPTAQMGMMKGQFSFMFLQGTLVYWVSHLFSGFLVAKTPFPLTFRFKSMLQRGVEVDNLDPGYISGLSFYFIIMFAGSGLQMLISSIVTGEKAPASDAGGGMDDAMMMMGVPPMGASPMGGAPDPKKIYEGEAEYLQIHWHEPTLENVETDLWRKWKAKG